MNDRSVDGRKFYWRVIEKHKVDRREIKGDKVLGIRGEWVTDR